jgi:hypothetical protein
VYSGQRARGSKEPQYSAPLKLRACQGATVKTYKRITWIKIQRMIVICLHLAADVPIGIIFLGTHVRFSLRFSVMFCSN